MSDAKKLTVCHLFPDLLDLYGDRGNILSFIKRLEWRGIDAELTEVKKEDKILLADADIVLLGGGSDREQKAVCEYLCAVKTDFWSYVDDGGVLLALCGGYPMLGSHLNIAGEKLGGLGIVDMYTEQNEKRVIGNVVLESDFSKDKNTVVGFENHSTKTYIKNAQPFGKVISGFGNNGEDKTEGIIYKNVLGTYLHGPILPKNPHITDELIKRALIRKYGQAELEPLYDTLENEAHSYAVNKFSKE